MNFSQAIASGFSNYVTFRGRAARSEFWFWCLFAGLVGLVANLIDISIFGMNSVTPVAAIASLALLLPGLAVSVRRLHDIDRTGWWLLLVFTIIGTFVLLYWDCVQGTDGPNRFGPDPLAAASPNVAVRPA